MTTPITKEILINWLGDDQLKYQLLLAAVEKGYETDLGNAIKDKDYDYAVNLLSDIEVYQETVLNLETWNFKQYEKNQIKRFL